MPTLTLWFLIVLANGKAKCASFHPKEANRKLMAEKKMHRKAGEQGNKWQRSRSRKEIMGRRKK